jgi:hypothetical protein
MINNSFLPRHHSSLYKNFWANLSHRYVLWTFQVLLWLVFDVTKISDVPLDDQRLRSLQKKFYVNFPKSLLYQDVNKLMFILKKDARLLFFFEHLVVTQFYYFSCNLTRRYLRRVAKKAMTATDSAHVTYEWLLSLSDAKILLLIRFLIHHHWFRVPDAGYCLPPSFLLSRIRRHYHKPAFKFFIPGLAKLEFDGLVAQRMVGSCGNVLMILIDGTWVNDKSLLYYFQRAIQTELGQLRELKIKIESYCEHSGDFNFNGDVYGELCPILGQLLMSQHYKYSFQQTVYLVTPSIQKLSLKSPIDKDLRLFATILVHPIILNLLRYLLDQNKKT